MAFFLSSSIIHLPDFYSFTVMHFFFVFQFTTERNSWADSTSEAGITCHLLHFSDNHVQQVWNCKTVK